jgi:hypothetical protein
MSQPFVKIEDKKLQLKAKLDFAKLGNVKVVSVLGKARMGKSSFLNCIASHLAKSNKKIFSSMGGFEHITKGIDFYHIPEQNILLLDSQGLAHYDSQHDPVLLLFIYLISDVIIFNERMMLQNEALKLLEPVCAFLNFVDLDDIVKPTLFFRISDGDQLGNEANKNLEKIMAEYPDQYQSIRTSIRHLFQDPLCIVKTNSLDKAPKAFIDAGTFKPLLDDEENGFKEAIETILATVMYPSTNKNKNLASLPRIIEQINNNQKIDISKLDVVQLTTNYEILEWIQQQPKENYASITVDGTQKSFEENVVPRQNKKKAILTAFSKRFKSVPDSVKEPYHAKLAAELLEPISNAIAESTRKAEERILSTKNIALEKYRKFSEITNNSSSFSITGDAVFVSQYLRFICNLETACLDIYDPVKQKYTDICKAIYKSFAEILNIVKGLEEENLKAINKYTNELLEEYVEKSNEKIRALHYSCLQQKDDDIVNKLFTDTVNEYRKTAEQLYVRYKIAGELNHNIAKFNYTKIGNLSFGSQCITTFESYDHTKACYAHLTNTLSFLNTSLLDAIVGHKKNLLFGKYMVENVHRTILLTNQRIEFITSLLVDSTMMPVKTFMLKETYECIYEPIIEEASKNLIDNGYLSKNFEIPYYIENTKDNLSIYSSISKDDNKKYWLNLLELLERKIKKIYCKKIVDGNEFAEELDLNSSEYSVSYPSNKETIKIANPRDINNSTESTELTNLVESDIEKKDDTELSLENTSSREVSLKAAEKRLQNIQSKGFTNSKSSNKFQKYLKTSHIVNIKDEEDKRIERISHSWSYDS